MRKSADPPTDPDRRRFANAPSGQLWGSDVTHGPRVAVGSTRRKTYRTAFINDATLRSQGMQLTEAGALGKCLSNRWRNRYASFVSGVVTRKYSASPRTVPSEMCCATDLLRRSIPPNSTASKNCSLTAKASLLKDSPRRLSKRPPLDRAWILSVSRKLHIRAEGHRHVRELAVKKWDPRFDSACRAGLVGTRVVVQGRFLNLLHGFLVQLATVRVLGPQQSAAG